MSPSLRHHGFLRLTIVLGLLIYAISNSIATAAERPLWTESRIQGSPEPPSPYTVERVFEHLAVKSPLYIAPEPGTESLLLLDRATNEPSPWIIRRFQNTSSATDSTLLLNFTNRQVYGFTFHPDYARNGFLYVFHNGPTDKSERTNRISRFTIDRQSPGLALPDSAQTIIEWRSAGHDGGDLAFGRDGMLYITSGDGTSDSDGWDSGQDMTKLLAKLLRIDVDRPEAGSRYSVPRDNPFVNLPGARPETWAYGFRNPWRMCIDSKNGDIWVGQNGQDLWESAHRVERGDNIGWSVYEGGHPFHPHRRRGPTPIVAPTIEHSHADFRSLTGGVVYYGSEMPELDGTYVYGDYSTGKIWGGRHRNGKLENHRELADTTLQIAAFRVVAPGRLLIVDHAGGIYRMLPRKSESPGGPFPRRLSETGLFASTRDHRVAAGVVPYSVNAPGWLDGAQAERFIAVPGTAKIGYAPRRGWNFTNGSVIVQTIRFPESQSPASEGRRIETRVLLRHEGEWNGYTYRWNDSQTDAELVEKDGTNLTLKVRSPEGSQKEQTWRIPSRAECMACHSRAAGYVLGLTEAQLNRPRSGRVPSTDNPNQLTLFADWSWLTDAPSTAPETRSKLVDPYDPSESPESRARAYLHANCSVCHIEAGGGNARMLFEVTQAANEMNLIGARPQHETFGIVNAMLVAPGEPGRSVILRRLGRRGPGQMPPLVSHRVDEEAVALFQKWIAGMKSDSTVVREWTVDELVASIVAMTPSSTATEGKAVFEKTGCIQCHRFGETGGAVGPDLSRISTRMDRRAILESIIEPSKTISDEYALYDVELNDGTIHSGRIQKETATELVLRAPSAVEEDIHIRPSHIRKRTKSTQSNMPAGIVNVLTREQILELLAYLISDVPAETQIKPR